MKAADNGGSGKVSQREPLLLAGLPQSQRAR